MSPAVASEAVSPPCVIRPYRPDDREKVRWLCCQTGFLGEPIDPVFSDRELFADFLTNYYLEREPEAAFVMEIGGEVRGYLLGCRYPARNARYNFWQLFRLAAVMLWRYPRYDAASRRFIHWILFHSGREVPAAPKGMPHFHINLLADAKSMRGTRELIDAFLRYLYANGVKSVYGQMVSFGNRRGEKMFERYGFRLLNKAEITKYRRFRTEPVYLCTVVRELGNFSTFRSQK